MKKEMKTIVIVSILAIGLFAVHAFAQNNNNTQSQQQMYGNRMGGGMMGGNQGQWGGMGCNGMMGGSMMNRMTPGQQQNFMNQTTELRKQMMELRFSYMEAMRNPNTSPEDLAGIEKQMLELRTKMMGKMGTMQSQ